MRYRSYRQYSTPRPKFYFSEREIDFTRDYFDYEQFLLQEFFTPDVDKRIKVRDEWTLKYGRRSYEIMTTKYLAWRDGDYHLTKEMMERIVDMMPRLLSAEALTKVGLFEFSRAIKGIVKSHLRSRVDRYQRRHSKLSIDEWRRLVIEEFKAIDQLIPGRHRYHPLSDDDVKAAASVAQYILQLKLSRYEEQVLRDLEVIQSVHGSLREFGSDLKYEMRRFAVELNLEGLSAFDMDNSGQDQQVLSTDGTYQAYADKYFAYELAQVSSSVNMEGASAVTFGSDLNMLLEHLEVLRIGELEVSLSQSLEGEGGILKVQVSVVPPKVAVSTLRRANLSLASAILGVALYSIVMLRLGLGAVLVFSALIILPWLLSTIVTQTGHISEARKSIRNHGQRKATGPV